MVSASRESVRLYLRDLKNLSAYGRKVDSVEVVSSDAEAAQIEASGKLQGIPWHGAFKVSFSQDGGFRGEMTRGPLKQMALVYHLRPVSGGTIITYEEHYQFPLLARPLAYLTKGWFVRMMDLELGAIKEGAELLNRRTHLQQIDSLA